MLPQLARTVLAEFDSMDKQLQAAVTALPLTAVTYSSPPKAVLKKRDRDHCEKIEELTGLNADLTAENTTLQGTLQQEVHFWKKNSQEFSRNFLTKMPAIFLHFHFSTDSLTAPSSFFYADSPGRAQEEETRSRRQDEAQVIQGEEGSGGGLCAWWSPG
jgi:hypothetical protein